MLKKILTFISLAILIFSVTVIPSFALGVDSDTSSNIVNTPFSRAYIPYDTTNVVFSDPRVGGNDCASEALVDSLNDSLYFYCETFYTNTTAQSNFNFGSGYDKNKAIVIVFDTVYVNPSFRDYIEIEMGAKNFSVIYSADVVSVNNITGAVTRQRKSYTSGLTKETKVYFDTFTNGSLGILENVTLTINFYDTSGNVLNLTSPTTSLSNSNSLKSSVQSTIYKKIGFVEANDSQFGSNFFGWVIDAVDGFLDFQIAPLSLRTVFFGLIGLLILIFIMKKFAGDKLCII